MPTWLLGILCIFNITTNENEIKAPLPRFLVIHWEIYEPQCTCLCSYERRGQGQVHLRRGRLRGKGLNQSPGQEPTSLTGNPEPSDQ